MTIQYIYEKSLDILGKSEEGTNFAFARRVPVLLLPYISTFNTFRGEAEQLPLIVTLKTDLDLTDNEYNALIYTLAYEAAISAGNFSKEILANLGYTKQVLLSRIGTGMQKIAGQYLMG